MPVSGSCLTLPAGQSVESKREARLLVQEAREYIADRPPEPFQRGQRTARKESGRRIRNYTADRLFREEPRRYKLIASMRANGVGMRQACRAAHCDARTVASVERREAETVPSVKSKLTRGFGQLARMTLERLQEEVGDMNHAQLAITAGIATDKLQTLTGDPNQIIRHDINDTRAQGSIFDRMQELAAQMAKTVQGRVIESEQPMIEA